MSPVVSVTRAASRSVTGAVLGLLAIPLLSVSTALLVGDVASSADPRRVVWGLPALVVGTTMGLIVVKITRTAAAGIGSVVAALLTWSRSGPVSALMPLAVPIAAPTVLVPVTAIHHASIRGRGPPVGLG